MSDEVPTPWWTDEAPVTPGPAPAAEPQPDESPAPRGPRLWQRRSAPSVAVTAALAALLGSAIGAGSVVAWDSNDDSGDSRDPSASIAQVQSSPTGSSTTLSRPAGSVASIAAAVLPSVVTIEESDGEGGGTGSGVVLRGDGYILTNNHVVDGVGASGSLTVIPAGKSIADGVKATVVGTDPLTDLAVIKAESGTWSPASLGHSSDLVVGDDVIAIGAPLGLRGTVTLGIVSALNRFVDIDRDTAYDRAIQTDAAINPGNSGGALVNASGQVVGINSAIATAGSSSQSGNIGLGFAIPIDEAAPVAEDIIRTGKASHPYLGVVTNDNLKPTGALLITKTDSTSGTRSPAVSPGSPADKAGLKEGDVITKVNDQDVGGTQSLIAAIRAHRTGESIKLTYVRGGSSRTVETVLVERPTN